MSQPSRPSTLRAVRGGLVRLGQAPSLVLLLWLAQLLFALPAAFLVGEAIHGAVADRPVHRVLEEGFDRSWYGEFAAEAEGVAATFEPGLIGGGALLGNLDRLWSGRIFTELPSGLLAWGALWGLAWLVLLGGAIDRMGGSSRNGDRGLALGELLGAGGRHLLPLLRLVLLSALLYVPVFWLSRLLFDALELRLREVTSETRVIVVVAAVAFVVALALGAIRAVFDYAKIAVVAEGRRSALGAAWSGVRFAFVRPLATAGLHLCFALLAAVVIAVYAAISPGAQAGLGGAILLPLLLGQLVLALRLGLRLALLGGAMVLYLAPASECGAGEHPRQEGREDG